MTGNGEKMLVCKNNWIPENAGFKILGPVRGLEVDSKVSAQL